METVSNSNAGRGEGTEKILLDPQECREIAATIREHFSARGWKTAIPKCFAEADKPVAIPDGSEARIFFKAFTGRSNRRGYAALYHRDGNIKLLYSYRRMSA